MGLTDQQIDDLVSQMSLAEKAGQLTQYFFIPTPADAGDTAASQLARLRAKVEAVIPDGGAGSVLFVTDPADANRLQRRAVEESRLGIPLLFGFDVIHGLRTIFPVPIGMAASWDLELIERAQAIAAAEARAVGIRWTFAPMVDVSRDPRWGRIVEGAGEDPYLGSAVAAAQVRGFQGEHLDRAGLIAGPKHFAGYGAALGGRDYDEVDLSDAELWNVYLPPFKAAIDAGAANLMTAYMDLNGIPATGSAWLLTDVLRNTWGFDGFVVSDADAVRNLVAHGFAPDRTSAAERALNAGVDMEMTTFDPAFSRLPDAVEAGAVDVERLDASVRRILTAKSRLGLFDDPYVDEQLARAVLADPEHRGAARTAAERSAVLLRNEHQLLPLDPATLRSVAVLGPFADSKRDTLGPWVFDVDLAETITVLEGIRAKLGPHVRIEHAPGVETPQRLIPPQLEQLSSPEPTRGPFAREEELQLAVRLAHEADVAVVVLGERHNMSGEVASRSSLELPGEQLDLLQAVVATGTPVVLVLLNGRPLDLRWAAEHVPAILEAWYPGTAGGGAVANLLVGDAGPAGRLPFTWPRSVGQVPITYAHTRSHDPAHQQGRYWDEPSSPLFPFGFGLTYSSFEYADLVVDRQVIGLAETVHVEVKVTNTGGRDADEVVQLYLHQRHGSASRPQRELKGFTRRTIAAGETQVVRFRVGPEERRYWNSATRDWTLDASAFDVWVGGDSSTQLGTSFTVARNP